MAKHRFGIHASIVFQLGEDLITDVVQALIELVKNCYDADADYAKIVVATDRPNDFPNTLYGDAVGYIVIEDNGHGMDEDAIQRGWLTISNSLKRSMKKNKETTVKGRTPLGDKGLGRLGVQRLGYNVEIFTKPVGSDVEYHVGWSWRDFEGESTLDQVKLHFLEIPSRRRAGTRLVISDLRDRAYWKEENSIAEFKVRLAELISPYKDHSSFTVNANIDGNEIETAEISDNIRRLAQVRYSVDFDTTTLKLTGRASLDFIRPKDKKQFVAAFEQLVEQDGGEKFFQYLSSQKMAQTLSLKRSRSKAWFVEFSGVRSFLEMPELKFVDASESEGSTAQTKRVKANPGPFYAEIDAFDLSMRTAKEQSAFDTPTLYREFVKNLSGVRIFRDGFGIRVDRDWLGLAKQWTGASSYYALKPENTIGFVDLSAKDNQNLVETTDREGFKITPYYENFVALFEEFRLFAHDAQEFLRRGWLDFVKEHHREVAEVESADTPEELNERITVGLAQARVLQKPLAATQADLAAVGEQATVALDEIAKIISSPPAMKRLRAFVNELESQLNEAQDVLMQLSEFIGDAAKLRDVSRVLQGETQELREQLKEAYEVVSLGLTAEALSHEIHNISNRLAQRTQDLSKYLARAKIADATIFAYVEYIKSSVNALRKQMAHLAPSLKYVREKREPIDLMAFLSDFAEFYRRRWEGEPLRFEIKNRRDDDFILNINRGKLTQIFDNLILNAEYWVLEELRQERIAIGTVVISLNAPIVLVYDNGPGVDPTVETRLFDPFISKKPKQKGRGLGLFIVRQLLDTENCTIELATRRNERGRMYQFKLDFAGAINDRD